MMSDFEVRLVALERAAIRAHRDLFDRKRAAAAMAQEIAEEWGRLIAVAGSTTPPCTASITVTGTADCLGAGLAGADVAISVNALGGGVTGTFSGSTDASGDCTIDVSSAITAGVTYNCNCTISHSSGRFASKSVGGTFVCGDTPSYPVGALGPAPAFGGSTGYSCLPGCGWPIKNTLQMTFNGSTFVLFKSGSSGWGSGIRGTPGVTLGAGPCSSGQCASVGTGTLDWRMSFNGSAMVGGYNTCTQRLSGQIVGTNSDFTSGCSAFQNFTFTGVSITCPSSFSITGTVSDPLGWTFSGSKPFSVTE